MVKRASFYQVRASCTQQKCVCYTEDLSVCLIGFQRGLLHEFKVAVSCIVALLAMVTSSAEIRILLGNTFQLLFELPSSIKNIDYNSRNQINKI